MPYLYQSTASACSNTLYNSKAQDANMLNRGISLKDRLLRRKSNQTNTTSPAQTAAASVTPFPSRPSGPSPPSSLLPSGPKQPAPPTRRPGHSASRGMNSTSGTDLPPAYSAPQPSTAASTDSKYAFLSHFDTVFLIDDSGSMSGGKWRETAAAIAAIAPICTAHDRDGIDIHFLNHRTSFNNITDAAAVSRIFAGVSPAGGTPTGIRLHQILKPYLASLVAAKNVEDVKPLNVIVITDGEAGDDVETPIKQCASKLDKLDVPGWQVGIQFFQVGRDPEAEKALIELDDGLAEDGDLRDIVDTVPWKKANGSTLDGEGILKVVL